MTNEKRPLEVGEYVYVHNGKGVCTGAGRITSITNGVARYRKGPGLYGRTKVTNLERHALSDHWREIEFNRDTARMVADAAESFTRGIVGLSGTGASVGGSGERMFSKKEQKVWYGHDGAVECIAYMVGAILAYARHTNQVLPDDVLWIRDYQDADSMWEQYRTSAALGAAYVDSYINHYGT